MAALPEPLLMTVEQYRELPSREDVFLELHWGQVVEVTRPKMKHTKIQFRLTELLRKKLEHLGEVARRSPFALCRNASCAAPMWLS